MPADGAINGRFVGDDFPDGGLLVFAAKWLSRFFNRTSSLDQHQDYKSIALLCLDCKEASSF